MNNNLHQIYDISIIGFGAIGVAFLKSLQSFCHEQEIKNLKILIISESKTLALGKAFGESDSIHRVNTPPELMSIQEEDPLGFKHWLTSKKIYDKYPPRQLFAEYLKETFISLKEDTIFSIDILEDEAIDIENLNDYLEIKTLKNYSSKAKKIILALGSLSESNFDYININLILPNEINKLKKDESKKIAVAGTSLTAIDCVRQLKKQGVEKVYLFSRTNQLPTPIALSNNYIPQYFIWKNIKSELIKTDKNHRLDKILQMFNKELELITENEYLKANSLLSNDEYLEYFSYLIKKAETSNLPIQDILTSTRYFAHKIWKLLSEDDKQTFQRKFSSKWAVWRHPIPLFIFKEIESYFHDGFIEIIKDAHITLSDNFVHITNKSKNNIKKVKYLIDATGGTIDIREIKKTLIVNLFKKEIILSNPCGGIKTDSLNFKVKNYQNLELYNLGPLSKGDLFSTNAFWYNCKCANELAYIISNNLKNNKLV